VKILVLSRPFAFHGGVERATAGLLGALAAHGHDVHVASPGAQPVIPGVTVHRLRLPPLPATARLVAMLVVARRAMRHGTWDVVQSHERTLGQDVYRAGEGCHRAYLATRTRPPGRATYHRLLLALERRVLERTPCLVAIARLGKAEIERLYAIPAARVHVVYNGVDLARFHPRHRATHRAAALAEAGVPAGAWVLLFVGSGFERKGLGTALTALAGLGDRESRLLVLGKGDPAPYRALTERLDIARRVAWLGPRRDVDRWYAAADAVVLPTHYEPFGNVHLEALASGVPVVTTTRAGGAEVIRDRVTGAVTEPGNPGQVTLALERLRVAPPEETRAACRAAAEPYTHRRQAEELTRLYRGLRRAKR
jgi:UDP-glucose:(heptosyl)LPS alpha-1,3-glucosyltransferase